MKPEPLPRLTKYTRQELEDRRIGRFVDPTGMVEEERILTKAKNAVYGEEGVLQAYKSLYKCFIVLLSNGDRNNIIAAKCAQRMMDHCLVQRSRGEKFDVPSEVHLYEKKHEKPTGMALFDIDDTEEKPPCSENEKLRWIFENMKIEGLEPSDAPSVGTFTLLMELRENQQARTKFYESLWPKLLAKEDAEKTGKLADTGKETVELIDRLIAALPESEETE
jgi:hypothetical protein